MDRLTEYKKPFGWMIKSDKGLRISLFGDISAWIKVIERLAAYEDTGLEPEEVERLKADKGVGKDDITK